ncbi:response regulator [Salsuginibacillus kocurii]|uniref:response regulator n=1 Tax=Salsuginibacillus kocurii TaxID=427078 RepID=UPI000364EC07|nr:response regulator [Salsuginibacillus kocurii]
MSSTNLSVVVCDDSLLIRKKTTAMLKELGYENIREATNGHEAVALFKDETPDVLLLDIVMPDLDGLQALKKIKDSLSNTFVIMVSSAGTQSHIKQSIQLGACDFIQKPITTEALQRVLDKITNETGENSHV